MVSTAQKLRRLLKVKGWSISKLAKRAGLNKSTVYNLFSRPLSKTNVAAAHRIAKVMQVSPTWLFGEHTWEECRKPPRWWPPDLDWNAAGEAIDEFIGALERLETGDGGTPAILDAPRKRRLRAPAKFEAPKEDPQKRPKRVATGS